MFQDGKVVFVRHGGAFVRVSPNRLIKVGSEFQDDESKDGKGSLGDEFGDQSKAIAIEETVGENEI